MDYQVKLDTFRGPLDLLLFLVKRQEVDIQDVSIARIAEQFLDYLRVLQFVDVEDAGEFLVMAATLMELKSRALLPRPEEANEGESDPRGRLIQQLLEFRRIKDAAALLEAQVDHQLSRVARQVVPEEGAGGEAPLRPVELWDLVSAFGRLMRETLALEPQQIVVDETPIQVHQDYILSQLANRRWLLFSDVFAPPRTRARLIGLFLALLELIRAGQIQADQEVGCGEISLRLGDG